MLSMQYAHRLPADYDMNLIRTRAAERGPLWDDLPGLAFKAFAMRERGRHGADGNVYTSIYLWRDARAASDFLVGDRFQGVIEGFGRPTVETWLPLDARASNAEGKAQVIYREDVPVAEGVDLAALHTMETRRNDALLARADTMAVVTSLDVLHWRLLRLTLSSAAVDVARAGVAYEVLHLARPGLAGLV